MWGIITGIGLLLGGVGYSAYAFFKKDVVFKDLRHCKVPLEWQKIRYNAWAKASNIMQINGHKAVTKCEKIIIEKGVKMNPLTKQWGRQDKSGFWYAGSSTKSMIKIVATPDGNPYNRSEVILAHEIGETMLYLDPKWSKKNNDERNKYLWSLGL